MHRIAVVGSSGAGKSSVADVIAGRLGVAVIELDDLAHGPDWASTPTPEFRAKVVRAIADAEGPDGSGGWVVPGNYRNVADLVQRRADTVVWLDLGRSLVTWRLLRRSITRIVTGAEVCNGNRERWRNLFSRDPGRNVVLWSWQHHDRYRALYADHADGDFWSGATVHRLRSRQEIDRFLGSISG